jgi:hypothetical protein
LVSVRGRHTGGRVWHAERYLTICRWASSTGSSKHRSPLLLGAAGSEMASKKSGHPTADAPVVPTRTILARRSMDTSPQREPSSQGSARPAARRNLRRDENTQFGGYAVRGDASQFYSWMVQAHREVLDGHGAPEDGQRQERRPKGGGEDTQICQEHIETGYCAVQRKESW